MLKRLVTSKLKELLTMFPVVSVTGPRQSGKSTLLKNELPDYRYVSLEDVENRKYALDDPKGFLERYDDKVIIDEAQYAPDLFSYLQLTIDQKNQAGQYVLSGSQNFLLLKNISQSLAGRVGILRLLPFSYCELSQLKTGFDLDELMFNGGYPRIYDMKIDPTLFYQGYVKTYLQKDVNELLKVRKLATFRKFLSLVASRAGQELNVSDLSRDARVEVKTIDAWLSVLQSSYVLYLLTPYYHNFGKRLIKSPKLYFYDTGLVCYLLGFRGGKQLADYDKRGCLFENFVISEEMKNSYNAGLEPQLFYWRDNNRNEIDLIKQIDAQTIKLIEIKSSRTGKSEFAKNVNQIGELAGIKAENRQVVFDGDGEIKLQNVHYVPWRDYLKSN